MDWLPDEDLKKDLWKKNPATQTENMQVLSKPDESQQLTIFFKNILNVDDYVDMIIYKS